MRIPRDISAQELLKLLSKYFGYEFNRQIGSHIRVTTNKNGTHHLTIPNHNPLKIGTFNSIISDVAIHFKISKEEVFKQIFI